MTAKKLIATDNRRETVNARFTLIDGVGLPGQAVLCTFPDFRRAARRVAAKSVGKLTPELYDFALDAINREFPRPQSSEKECRFHTDIRDYVHKLRDRFIEERSTRVFNPETGKKETESKLLKDLVPKWIEYSKKRLTPGGLGTRVSQCNVLLSLSIELPDGSRIKFGNLSSDQIDPGVEGFGQWVVDAIKAKYENDNTRFNAVGNCKRVVKYLQLTNRIKGLPTYPSVPEGKPDSKYFTESQLKTIFEECQSLYKLRGTKKNFLRGFFVARFTGARRGEIRQLKIKDFHVVNSTKAFFICPKVKTGEKNVKIKASNPYLIKFLQKDFASRGKDEVFVLDSGQGTEWCGLGQLTKNFSELNKRLGITGVAPLHGYRHTVCNETWLISGDPRKAQAQLRHNLSKTTNRYLNDNLISEETEKTQALLGAEFDVQAPSKDEQIAALKQKLAELEAA